MTDLDNNKIKDLDDEITDLDNIAAKQKRVLRRLLDSYISGSKILVNRMHMGKTLDSMPKAIQCI